ncbi:hypothetical protein CapIbe_000391 [Capra ibex]
MLLKWSKVEVWQPNPRQMLDWRLASTHFILAMTLMLWSSGKVFSVGVTTEAFDSGILGVQSSPTVREDKSATDLAAKLLLLDELVSLENDVIETKKKRSFSGFGSPLDRLSAGSESSRSSKKAIWYPYGSNWKKPAFKFQRLMDSSYTTSLGEMSQKHGRYSGEVLHTP